MSRVSGNSAAQTKQSASLEEPLPPSALPRAPAPPEPDLVVDPRAPSRVGGGPRLAAQAPPAPPLLDNASVQTLLEQELSHATEADLSSLRAALEGQLRAVGSLSPGVTLLCRVQLPSGQQVRVASPQLRAMLEATTAAEQAARAGRNLAAGREAVAEALLGTSARQVFDTVALLYSAEQRARQEGRSEFEVRVPGVPGPARLRVGDAAELARVGESTLAQIAEADAELQRQGAELFWPVAALGISLLPVVGNTVGLAEAVSGRGLFTQDRLSWGERGLNVLFAALELGPLLRGARSASGTQRAVARAEGRAPEVPANLAGLDARTTRYLERVRALSPAQRAEFDALRAEQRTTGRLSEASGLRAEALLEEAGIGVRPVVRPPAPDWRPAADARHTPGFAPAGRNESRTHRFYDPLIEAEARAAGAAPAPAGVAPPDRRVLVRTSTELHLRQTPRGPSPNEGLRLGRNELLLQLDQEGARHLLNRHAYDFHRLGITPEEFLAAVRQLLSRSSLSGVTAPGNRGNTSIDLVLHVGRRSVPVRLTLEPLDATSRAFRVVTVSLPP